MNIRSLTLILGMLALVPSAGAQERRTIGLGIKLNPMALTANDDVQYALLPVGLTSFSVPINVARNFRIEPDLGIWTSSSTATSTFTSDRAKLSSTYITAGAGLLYVQPIDESFDAYAGIRAGIVSTNRTVEQSVKTTSSELDLFVGPCGAGEYFFSPHFSIGAEVQINYIGFGEPKSSSTGGTPPTSSAIRNESAVTTNAVILFRCYL